jgi:hypothetical protein
LSDMFQNLIYFKTSIFYFLIFRQRCASFEKVRIKIYQYHLVLFLQKQLILEK